jgi:hypothetical protein
MLPLYAARIEDLEPGDFLRVDCAACHHVALLSPEALPKAGLRPATKVLDLIGRLRCRGCGKEGACGGFDQVAGIGRVSRQYRLAPGWRRNLLFLPPGPSPLSALKSDPSGLHRRVSVLLRSLGFGSSHVLPREWSRWRML